MRNPVEGLTARERQVLELLCLGHTSEEIGDLLGIRTATVRTFRDRINARLGTHSAVQAVAMYLRSQRSEREATA